MQVEGQPIHTTQTDEGEPRSLSHSLVVHDRVCGLSRVVLVVLANESKRAGAEDFLSHTPAFPYLGIVVALTLHGQMDMKGRPMGVGRVCAMAGALLRPGLCS